ncbi:MAG: hypothetical protein U0736_09300 [Gemmataceae bacterium]
MSLPSSRVTDRHGWRGLAFPLVAVSLLLLTGCPRKPMPPRTPPVPPPPATVPPAKVSDMASAAESATVTPVIASAARPWDAVAQRHLFEGHRDTVLSVAFSPPARTSSPAAPDGTAHCGI